MAQMLIIFNLISGSSASASKLITGSRGLHATGAKSMGGHDEPFYLHARHMYNLNRMKHQKLKVSLAVFSAFSIGVAVPVYAVVFQQQKTASG
ncbi:uncharacterized protein A4U43_C10F5380 [Asparagus officinalis]|uniref:SLL1 protein n=1 Tax=Asparagus officinalis TaxID=4686 RepID=A0A5P1E0W2_ASPOF|nr:uncharacterized protein A4U43_C10F5380 [Asparagus officinalis]